MKKNRGFALVETLIVSTVVASVLIYIFVEVNNLQSRYNESFRYNDIDDLYKLDSLKNYLNTLSDTAKTNIKSEIDTNTYVMINYDNDTYTNIDYFDNQDNLLSNLDIKTLIITYADTNKINQENFSNSIKNMIKRIDNKSSNYRMIVLFNNNSLATITFNI